MTQKQLAEAVGVSEPSIRLYELGKRTPGEDVIRQIAEALEIRSEALHAYDTNSAREVLEMLFRLEDEYGLSPYVRRLRKTKDAYKKDWACEVTIPIDTNNPEGKWHEEEG